MCRLLNSLVSRILEDFVKLPPAFNTPTAVNPTLHTYDAAKGITIRSDFFIKAGYSSFSEIQKFVGFPVLNLFLGNHHGKYQFRLLFLVRVKDDEVGWTKGSRIHS